MLEETKNGLEDIFLAHGFLGAAFAMILGSYCGLFGRSLKSCFFKGILIPGAVSLGFLPMHIKNRQGKNWPLVAGKSLGGFCGGYGVLFLICFSVFWIVRRFFALFIKSLNI